jgi:glycosyl transferase family 25
MWWQWWLGSNTAKPYQAESFAAHISALPDESRTARDTGDLMRAYVINLTRSPERRAHMVAELAKCSIDIEFVDAVDRRHLDVSDPGITDLVAPSFLSVDGFRLGVAAAALSHLSVYRKIISGGLDIALVLEDDVIVPQDLASLVDAVAEQLVGAEVALLNFDSEQRCKLSRQGSVDLPDSRQLVLPINGSEPVSGGAYLITRQACERLEKNKPPVCTKPDDWTRFYNEGLIDRVWCVVPMAVTKSPDFASTIDYNSESGLKARLLRLVVRHDVRIAKRALSYRRQRIWRRYTRVEFVD